MGSKTLWARIWGLGKTDERRGQGFDAQYFVLVRTDRKRESETDGQSDRAGAVR